YHIYYPMLIHVRPHSVSVVDQLCIQICFLRLLLQILTEGEEVWDGLGLAQRFQVTLSGLNPIKFMWISKNSCIFFSIRSSVEYVSVAEYINRYQTQFSRNACPTQLNK
ncbi:hypothetical protein ACJX0J_005384, partial [Zea mays]